MPDLNLSARKNGRGYTVPIKVPRQITYNKRNNTPKKSSFHENSIITDVCRLDTSSNASMWCWENNRNVEEKEKEKGK